MLSRSVNACINKLAHRVGTDAEKDALVCLFVEALRLKSEGKTDAEVIQHVQDKVASKPLVPIEEQSRSLPRASQRIPAAPSVPIATAPAVPDLD